MFTRVKDVPNLHDFHSTFGRHWLSMYREKNIYCIYIYTCFLKKKILFCVPQVKKVPEVWNDMRVNKWFHFWVTYRFKWRWNWNSNWDSNCNFQNEFTQKWKLLSLFSPLHMFSKPVWLLFFCEQQWTPFTFNKRTKTPTENFFFFFFFFFTGKWKTHKFGTTWGWVNYLIFGWTSFKLISKVQSLAMWSLKTMTAKAKQGDSCCHSSKRAN